MGLDRLTLGLWLRMLVASVVAAVGTATLVVAEVALAALMAASFIAGIPDLAVTFLAFVAVVGVALAVWVAVGAVYRRLMPVPLVVGRISHDGMADAVDPVARELADPTVHVPRRAIAVAVGGPILALAAVLAIDLLPGITPFEVGVVVGVGAACYGTGRLVYDEWTADGAVRADVAETAGVPRDDPDDELAAERVAIQGRVDRLAAQADVPAPSVSLGRANAPVAASVGYRPSTSTIVVSTGLCDRLSDRELDAVLAHELAHVINRDAAVLTALSLPATKIESTFAEADQQADDAETNSSSWTAGPHHGYLLVLEIPIFLVTRWALAVVARHREYVADRGAVALTGDPAALAGALETLDRDLARRPGRDLRKHRSTAAFAIVPPPWEEHRFFDRTRRFVARRLFGTHPPTASRIERLRERV